MKNIIIISFILIGKLVVGQSERITEYQNIPSEFNSDKIILINEDEAVLPNEFTPSAEIGTYLVNDAIILSDYQRKLVSSNRKDANQVLLLLDNASVLIYSYKELKD